MLMSQAAVGPHSIACIISAAKGHFLYLPHGWKWDRPETFSNMGMDVGKRITQSADGRTGRPAVILKGGLYGGKGFSLKQLVISPRP